MREAVVLAGMILALVMLVVMLGVQVNEVRGG